MEHLFGISAYKFDLDEYGGSSEAIRLITGAGADGTELLTGYFDPDPMFTGISKGVHLPYATDWYSVWCGDIPPATDDEKIKFRSYGRNRDEIIRNLTDAVIYASSLSPEYGVIHASSIRTDEIMNFTYKDKDEDVVRAIIEILNGVASSFPGNEMPFRIVLENLWWPGLSMIDDSGFKIIAEESNFDNWGLCLDVGHLMCRLGNCRDEKDSINDILKIVRSYPKKMRDRIDVMHMHMSLSADYIRECIERPIVNEILSYDEMMKRAYEHVCKVDEHRPFTQPICTDIVRSVSPKYVTHEISAPTPSERISGFVSQRSLF